MKIAIAADHAGFEYKETVKQHLIAAGHDVQDFGTSTNESCDYSDFVRPAAQAVAAGQFERGIVLGGSGNGEAIVSNRIPGIRATVCWNVESATFARSHNDANILSLGQRMIAPEDLLKVVDVWMTTDFEGGRHARRINKIDAE
ncbi:MAG: ribose 5-phosphate isomerase B [Planctomycetota bacterium]|jgi:ribose 5-phosphate isomerase B